MEESIVVKIEDQVSGLDDVKAVKSVAAPGISCHCVGLPPPPHQAKIMPQISRVS